MSDLLKQLAAMRPDAEPEYKPDPAQVFKCGLCHTQFLKRSQLESHAISCKVKPDETADISHEFDEVLHETLKARLFRRKNEQFWIPLKVIQGQDDYTVKVKHNFEVKFGEYKPFVPARPRRGAR